MTNPLSIRPEVTTVQALIDRMAEMRSGEIFLISPETKRKRTFEGLRQGAIELAGRLLDLGLSKGEKVSFLLDNGLFTAELVLGAMYGGFVPVPLNVGAGPSQLAYVLNHSDTAVVFVSDEYSGLLQSSVSQVERHIKVIPTHVDHGPSWSGVGPQNKALPKMSEEDDALLIYTSGSTSQAKGVLVSHRNVLANGFHTVQAHRLSPQDSFLCVLPLYHMNAQITLMATLLSGGTLVMPHRFNVTCFWDWIAEHRCTWSSLVPTIISHLLNWTDPYAGGKGTALEHIRFMRSSSAPLAPSQHRAFEEKFKVVLIEAMGSTEAGGKFFFNPLPPAQRKIGSPGIPHGFDVKVVDALERELSPGQTGEIVIRGPSVMKGYYKNPQATAEVIGPDGWLRTGDLGYRDDEGYFFIIGRAKEIIIKGGENIAPREIDEVLERHPAVMEAAAVGVPDPYLGEDIVAYVVLKPGRHCDDRELLASCEEQLGHFKSPTRIYFIEDLPKGPSGKVQRLKLMERTEKTAQSEARATRGDSGVGDPRGMEPERGFMEARTPIEKGLTEIWAEVLELNQIGVHDNFFDLGGHSLLATQVISRVREVFQVAIPLRQLFEAPTVAGLAERIEIALSVRRTAPDDLPGDREKMEL